MIKVFSRSKKVTKKVIPKLYKKELTPFEKSDTNMLRSVAVYYSGGVMGKENIGHLIGIAVMQKISLRL